MDTPDLKKTAEALLFITHRPLSLSELLEILEEKSLNEKTLRGLIQEISDEYEGRESAVHIREVAGGFQMATRTPYAPWIRRLYKDETTTRLSTSALETLSIVGYKQPITRAEIEEIRGVEVIAVLETLLERRLVKVLGRKEAIGRPLVYGTTPEFLRQFGLKSLSDLPALPDGPPPSLPEPDPALAAGASSAADAPR
jgi:segregation and condensation protein B